MGRWSAGRGPSRTPAAPSGTRYRAGWGAAWDPGHGRAPDREHGRGPDGGPGAEPPGCPDRAGGRPEATGADRATGAAPRAVRVCPGPGPTRGPTGRDMR